MAALIYHYAVTREDDFYVTQFLHQHDFRKLLIPPFVHVICI